MQLKKIFSRGNVLYVLYVLAFIIIALEIFGRVYLSYVLKKSSKPKFIFDYGTVYRHKAGFSEGDGTKNWIEINNQGFRRSSDVLKIKPANVVRIFLLGGSAAHGITSSPPYPIVHIYMNETIDSYLEQLLRLKYPDKKIEVINAAVTGYQVFQHTNYILSELLDYQPDMFIFFDGANDHFINNPAYNYYLDNKYQFWKHRLQTPSLGGLFDYCMLWLSNYSGFARGYYAWKLNCDATENEQRNRVNIPFKNKEEVIIQHKLSALNGFLRAMETNLQIITSRNIKTIITLQPMLVLRNFKNLSVIEKSFIHTDETCVALYPTVVDELKMLTQKYNTPFFDFNPVFNDSKYSGHQLLIDYCHLSAEGGKVVAESIFPVVDSLLQNKP